MYGRPVDQTILPLPRVLLLVSLNQRTLTSTDGRDRFIWPNQILLLFIISTEANYTILDRTATRQEEKDATKEAKGSARKRSSNASKWQL